MTQEIETSEILHDIFLMSSKVIVPIVEVAKVLKYGNFVDAENGVYQCH